MTRRFLENLESDAGEVVPAGVYDVEVVDARPIEGKSVMWLDLKVTGGPDAGRVVSVTLMIPDDNSSRGAVFHFKKKFRGFAPAVNMGQILNLPDDEQVAAIADAIIGAKIEAVLSVQQGGNYDGSQQLDETKPLAGTVSAAPAPAPAPAATAPAPAPAAAPAPAPAPVAAAPTPAEPEVSVTTSAVLAEDEVPF